MKFSRQTVTYVIIFSSIVIAAMLVFTWFKPLERYYGTDLYFPENRSNFFHLSFTSWDDRSLGQDNFRMYSVAYPFGLYLAGTEKLGIPVAQAEHGWLYFLFVSSGISFALFAITLWGAPKKKMHGVLYVCGALVYMFNPYTSIMLYSFPYLFHIYAFLPLKLAAIYYGISRQKGFVYAASILIPWVFLTTSSYSNPKYLLIDWIPIGLMALGFIIRRNKKEITFGTLRFLGICIVLFSLLSFFWILPTFAGIQENVSSMHSYYESLGGRSRETNFIQDSTKYAFDAVRQLGYWAIQGKLGDAPYIPWVSFYNSLGGVILSFFAILLFLAPLTLTLRKKMVLYKTAFSFWVFALIGMLGSASFVGAAALFVTRRIPYLIDVFSNPFQMFGLYASLLFAFLLVSATILLLTNVRTRAQVYLGLSALTLFIVTTFFFLTPFIQGSTIRRNNDILRPATYIVPEYVKQLESFLAHQSDNDSFRTLYLPYSKTHYGSYLWEDGYNGLDLNSLFVGRDLAGIAPGPRMLARALSEGNVTLFDTLLPLYNVRYVVLTLDANTPLNESLSTWYEGFNLSEVVNSIPTSSILTYKTAFGPLVVYEVRHPFVTSLAYIPHATLSDLELGTRDAFMRVSPDSYALSQNIIPSALGKASVEKVISSSADVYQVEVTNIESPFTLILNTNYHSAWKLSVFEDGRWRELRVPHAVVNDYANGWTLTPSDVCASSALCNGTHPGKALLQISFDRKKYFEAGYLISGSTLCILIVALGALSIYRRYAISKKTDNSTIS